MTAPHLIAVLPLMILAATAVLVLMVIAWTRNHALVAVVTLLGLVLCGATLPLASAVAPRQVTPLLVVDHYGLFYIGLLGTASGVVAILAYGYLAGRPGRHEEFYVLLLLATLGAMVLVVSRHFASLFLGLEILTVALYVLLAYVRTSRSALEAGIKYLILAAASSAFLLFGMGLVYADLGTMELPHVAAWLATGSDTPRALALVGVAMLVTGIGFKLAVVPFHLWTADVYEGAPAPVTAFIATASKGAMLALVVRYFVPTGAALPGALWLVFCLIALASMCTGNMLALLQQNVKRLLAYSSIAHLGYLFVAVLASGSLALEAVTYYLVAYFITTLGAFGCVTLLSDRDRDADRIEDYRGLFWRRPGLAACFTAMLLSLAGIPLTAGFVGKFYVLAAGVASTLWLLVVFLALNSALGLFYYLRLVAAMYMPPPARAAGQEPWAVTPAPLAVSAVLVALTIGLLWLGISPTPLAHVIQTIAVRTTPLTF